MARTNQTLTAADQALEALYVTFNCYQGQHFEGCPHCVSFEDSAALRRAPLRRLGRELDRYLFKALTTWGTEDDFKHFLPRLLELYASSSDSWLLCDKLGYARWRSWPDAEKRAVENYLMTVWREALANYGFPLPGNFLLTTMATLELDLAPYDLRVTLNEWRMENTRESARRLADFVLEHNGALFGSSPSSGRLTLWQLRPDIAEEVREWLVDPSTRDWLEASFLAHGDADVARVFDSLESVARYG